MKRSPGLALALLVVAALGVVSPLLAAPSGCPEDGGTDDCCELGDAVCLCCSQGPQTAWSEPGPAGEPDGRLRPEKIATPREPLPRDVLHVPRAAPGPSSP